MLTLPANAAQLHSQGDVVTDRIISSAALGGWTFGTPSVEDGYSGACKLVATRLTLPNARLLQLDNRVLRYLALQHIDLSDNGIVDISALNRLPQLVHVNLAGNRIAQLPRFVEPPLTFVRHLDLSRNQLTSMANVDQFSYLQSLCLDHNLITKMVPLEKCRHLGAISLRHNGLSVIEGLASLASLTLLDLRHNRLRAVAGLGTCTALAELDVGSNYISSLDGLTALPNLRRVNIDSNNITDIESIMPLVTLPNLATLSLRKNPLEQIATDSQNSEITPVIPVTAAWYAGRQQFTAQTYLLRLFVLSLMPTLSVLNGQPVSAEDLHRVNKTFSPTSAMLDAHHAHIARLKVIQQYARIKASDLALSTRYRPIVIAGPAGVGKRTLTRRLLQEYPHLFGLCVSHTTRAPRPGEENGVHYYFVSKQEIQRMMDDGCFVEMVSFFGNWYGNSFDSVYSVALEGKICVMDLELEGVLALKQQSQLSPRYIYLTAPSYKVLQERLESRVRRENDVAKEQRDKDRRLEEQARALRQQQLASQYVSGRRSGTPTRRRHDSQQSVDESDLEQYQLRHRDPSAPATSSDEAEQRSGDGNEELVAQWLEKAHKDTARQQGQDTVDKQDAMYAPYIDEPGFFDHIVVNDDLESAYDRLRSYILNVIDDSSAVK